jgi:hypothetical protein
MNEGMWNFQLLVTERTESDLHDVTSDAAANRENITGHNSQDALSVFHK